MLREPSKCWPARRRRDSRRRARSSATRRSPRFGNTRNSNAYRARQEVLWGARGALLKRPAVGVCSEYDLLRRRRERRETPLRSLLYCPITNEVPAVISATGKPITVVVTDVVLT